METEMERRSTLDSNSNHITKPPHKILVQFIIDETNNKQWLNYACKLLMPVSEIIRPGLLDPEDYLEEVKTNILKNTIIVDDNPQAPLFESKTKTRVLRMNRQFLKHHIFLQIYSQITHAIRSQKRIIRYPDDEEIEDNNIETWDDLPVCGSKPNGDFIQEFEDTLDENVIFNSKSKEFIELCLQILEKKDMLWKLIFDDKLSGMTNLELAEKYNLTVRQVENYYKRIIRYLKKHLII
jgi:hypothetical protein